jgi:hypothetical protein
VVFTVSLKFEIKEDSLCVITNFKRMEDNNLKLHLVQTSALVFVRYKIISSVTAGGLRLVLLLFTVDLRNRGELYIIPPC